MSKRFLGAALVSCALFAAPGLASAAERAIPPSGPTGARAPQERAGVDPCAGDSLLCSGGDPSSPGSRRAYNGPALNDFYDIAPADAYPPSAQDGGGYCASRYRSWDSRSGTYLGNDGRRHPCP